MTAIGDDKGDDLGPVPAINPELLPMGFSVMQRHFKTADSEMFMPEDLEDVLNDLMEALSSMAKPR